MADKAYFIDDVQVCIPDAEADGEAYFVGGAQFCEEDITGGGGGNPWYYYQQAG